jgi:hypothetical protein
MKITALLFLLLGISVTAFAEEQKVAEEKPEAQSAETLAADASAPAESPEADPAMMMPAYTVSSSRISELDIQIKKLDKTIAKLKKKIKPSELDETLNSDDAPKALLIFGGKTAGQRKSVAAERVNFLEAERDILEAMKHVRTKKDEAELMTQLNAFKTMSRQLDETLR